MNDRSAEVPSEAQDEGQHSEGIFSFTDSLEPRTKTKLVMLGYLLDEDSDASNDLSKIIDGVLLAGAHNFKRIIAHLNTLNENLRDARDADPRQYAKRVLRGNDDPAA